jgi:CBS domain containing-hemolysin-like protein
LLPLLNEFWRITVAQAKKKHSGKKQSPDYRWMILIFLTTVVISGVMSFISSNLLESATLAVSFVILICIILIGIVFDIVGVAVTAAVETPFHAMASRKVPEAPDALRLIRNANRVSSFCNDVIGDICGVISGSASAVIAARVILLGAGGAELYINLLMSALVAGLTVGGKAFGKTFAMQQSTVIVQATAKVLHFFRQIPEKFRRKKS